MTDTQDKSSAAIHWVTQEVRLELDKALKNLETYSESRDKRDYLSATVRLLAEIKGVLKVTGQTALSLLVEEMEMLLNRHLQHPEEDSDIVLNTLAEGLLALSSALSSGAVSTIHLVPRLNNIRALSGGELASETSLFSVNLNQGLKAFARDAQTKLDADLLRKLRRAYQQAMLALLKGEASEAQNANLQKVFKALQQLSGKPVPSAIGYIGLLVVRQLESGNLKLDAALQLQLRRTDQYLQALMENLEAEDTGLLKNLLFALTQEEQHSETSHKVFKLFGIDELVASQSSSDAAYDAELVARVASELQTELDQTKIWLDDAINGVGDFSQTVRQISTVFKRVVDTLMMLGVSSMKGYMDDLHERLQEWQDYDKIESVSAEDLQWFADQLVDLEEEVNHLANPGAEGRKPKEFSAALKVIVSEGRGNLGVVKQALSQFLEQGQSPAELNDIPMMLTRLEGALRFYPLPQLADLTRSARLFIREQIIDQKNKPDTEQAEQLADILVAVDYYLECLEQGTETNLDFLIRRALEDCAALGYSIEQVEAKQASAAAETSAQVEEVDTTEEASDESEDKISPVEEQDLEAPSEQPPEEAPVEASSQLASEVDDDDDDILAIFAEEAEEILPQAKENYADWCGGSDEALADLRRAFHTLKGGGRMVGAVVVGELSWALENLLNKVMEGSVNAGQAVMHVVGLALDEMPSLLDAMKQGNSEAESDAVANIRETAEMLANPSAVRSDIVAQETESAQTEPLEDQPVADESSEDSSPELISEEKSSELDINQPEISTTETRESSDFEPQEPEPEPESEPEPEFEPELHTKRFEKYQPLQELLADQLNTILDISPVLDEWQVGALSAQQQQDIGKDLDTLTEAAQRAEVPVFVELAGLLSDIYKNHAAAPLDQDRLETLLKGHDQLVYSLDYIASAENVPDLSDELKAALIAAAEPVQVDAGISETEESISEDLGAESASEPADLGEDVSEIASEPEEGAPETETPKVEVGASEPEDDFDRELLDTFLEEADDLQNEVGEALEAWRIAPEEFSHADAIHRSLHTLKGGARLAGLEQLGTMSHEFESLIIDHQVMRSVDEGFFTKSFQHFDQIAAEIERVKDALANGASPAELKASSSEVSSIEPAMQVTPLPDVQPPARKVEELAEQAESGEQQEAEASQGKPERREQFRVEAEMLDKMVNLTGEAIVLRGRIEAQVNGFDTILEELHGTTERIQQVSRRLDAGTQAQITFRREQIAESNEEEEFDPLEMDRYSQLQQLSHQLIEAASDLQDLRASLLESSRETKALLLQNSRIQSELNDRLMDTRMVPFSRIVPRLQRMTRQIASELGKSIRLDVGVVEGEMDRQVLDQILSPLEHILRNAIDHGIEDEAGRSAAGKDATGTIHLDVKRDGAHMVMRISDDGRGIDVERIRERAIERELVNPEKAASMDEKALLDIIFAPGFSTAQALTQISGRGVGMDVVRSKVRDLGGSVEIESEAGKGTTFKLYLPFTLSVNRALMVRIADDIYALPLASLEALVRVTKEELAKYYDDPERRLIYGSSKFRFGYLGEFLNTLPRPTIDSITESSIPLVLFRSGEFAIAIQVDEILGSQEVVVKSLNRPLHDVPGMAGAAIMGDGSVVVTLDMFTLMQSYDRRLAAGDDSVSSEPEEEVEAESRAPRIMVVDDSVTVRKVTSRFLTREGFLVESARDGVEALRQVHDHKPDLMLVDLEMPRMDGFELLSILRSNERFAGIPVFIITSRTGDKHRERGLELGAQRYFGKPYREEEVLESITEVLQLDHRRKLKN